MASDSGGVDIATRALWRFLAGELEPLWSRLLEGSLGAPGPKADGDLVYGVIDELRERTSHFLSRRYPGLPLNEEGQSSWPPRGDCIAVDLVDGTNSLLLGAPLFGLQFATVVGGRVEEAVIFLPTEARLGGAGLHVSRRGAGAHAVLRGETAMRLRVSPVRELAKASIGFDGTTPTVGALYHPPLVAAVTRIRNFGAFCWAGTRLVRGAHLPVSLDAIIAIGNKPWDHLPAVGLVEEAGGQVTCFDGSPHALTHCTELLFSNGHLHAELLGHLRGAGLSRRGT
ncbi:inositol monophosphatase family protein [Corallococcus sp. EGB]|uniref:inositol monophosphatase family protein n=1 Tax=Corallococcus sp. EGB TaxID=1521117 RepID=UPI001CBBB4F0|nr:inositol monophosphatase family protein [Corallococcus sp. EGB]